jgi:ribonuclease HI
MLPKIEKLLNKEDNSLFQKKPATNKIFPEFDYILKFDGCSKGNPGLAASGAVLYHQNKEVWSDSLFLGNNFTNNQAEYSGLILGLEHAKELGIKMIKVEGDSQLIINQMKGTYRCQSKQLLDLHNKAKDLEKNFEVIEYFHIYRTENKRADQLANDGIIPQNYSIKPI